LPARDSAAPRLRLLSSPTAQALRHERGSLIVWLTSVGAFAYIIGVIAKSINSAGISKSLQREIQKLGSGSILNPTGYLAFVFVFFILAISLFACAQVGAARYEEADQQLETLLALPVGRRNWLGGRRLGGRQHLAAADARGRRKLPAGRTPVPRNRGAGLRGCASSQHRGRVRACDRRVPVEPGRLAARRAEMARRPDAVRARRTRTRSAVSSQRSGRDAGDRGGQRARGDPRVPTPRHPGRV